MYRGSKRMEKEGARGHYRAYEGLMKASNNGNTSSSLKRSSCERARATHPSRQVRCLCFGGVPDKASHHSFLKGCVINLGICALLVAYTLLGSFIFLAIEGGDAQHATTALVATMPATAGRRNATNAWLKQVRNTENLSLSRFFLLFLHFSSSLRFLLPLVSIFVASVTLFPSDTSTN